MKNVSQRSANGEDHGIFQKVVIRPRDPYARKNEDHEHFLRESTAAALEIYFNMSTSFRPYPVAWIPTEPACGDAASYACNTVVVTLREDITESL